MTVVERLKEYRKLKAEIRAIELDIEELKDNENIGPAPISYEERTGKTYKFNSITENVAVDLIEKIEKLERRKRMKDREICKIDNALNMLEHKEREIVELRYIKGFGWNVVISTLDRSYQQCKRVEKKALDKINSIIF